VCPWPLPWPHGILQLGRVVHLVGLSAETVLDFLYEPERTRQISELKGEIRSRTIPLTRDLSAFRTKTKPSL
jgi:hypothetical protein